MQQQALLEFFIDIAGTIDVKELMEIVGNLYEMEGFSKVIHHNLTQFSSLKICTIQDTAHERARTVFKLLDKDGSGELDEEEFVRGCLRKV